VILSASRRTNFVDPGRFPDKHLSDLNSSVPPSDAGVLCNRQAGADRGDLPLACSPKELEEFIDATKSRAAGWIGLYWGKLPVQMRRPQTTADAPTLGWQGVLQRKAKEGAP
jgi:hypothetical protein